MMHALRRLLKQAVGGLRSRMPPRREAGLQHEQHFWDRWLASEGLAWPADFRERLDPQRPLQDALCPYVESVAKETVRILDVGAGPLTILGKTHPTRRLEIVAVDVLAPAYNALLARYGVVPLVETVYADAERLAETFDQNTFDVVHARNCVDHMTSPLAAIAEMLRVVHPGGYVFLAHAENEADTQAYSGLHQWNFRCEKGRFVVESARAGVTDVAEQLGSLATFTCTAEEGWVIVAARKRAR